jgi:hypothetical protein
MAAGAHPAVERWLGVAPETIPEGALADVFEHRLQDDEAVERSKQAPVVSELIERTIGELTECPDFAGAARQGIQPVVVAIIRFLASRQDAQGGGPLSRTGYLFRADALEKALGFDLIEWLQGNGLYGFTVEAQEIGGGRTDLTFTFDSFRFVVELKREKADTSMAGLKKYLRQAVTYQVTDVPIGMLIVLDLTGALPQHIRDNVWVDRFPSADPDGTERFVVVVRVPGNRKVPSKV